MDLKLQLIINHSSKALIFKLLLLATAVATIPCFNLISEIDPINGCDPPWARFRFRPLKMFGTPLNSTAPENPPNPRKALTLDLDSVFKELIASGWVARGDRALCVGRGAARAVMVLRKLGFRGAVGVDSRACSSLVVKGDPYRLPFAVNSFDFVYSGALDSVPVPARLVIEMERVLRPGKAGAVGRCVSGPLQMTEVMKAAAPVSSFLRFSDVAGVRTVNSSVMVVFKKRDVAAEANKQLLLPQELPQSQ